jgi:UDP-3-O-[3-hydroxymyristoyl] N-acetylglucosamine deacetylase
MQCFLRKRATIQSPVKFHGIGVHSGVFANVTVCPNKNGTGIFFRRTDVIDADQVIEVDPKFVTDSVLCTRLMNKFMVSVSVVEHLLAALRICGISDAEIMIDTSEVPIMDGSAAVFVEEFRRVGITSDTALVPFIVISEPISVQSGNSTISVTPYHDCRISVDLTYERIASVVGSNKKHSFNMRNNLEDISEARTFGWLSDYEKICNKGLAIGASEDNTIVILNDGSIKNKEGLRHKKELVMHKCLDLIGDLSILGMDIIGKISAVNPSHAINMEFVRAVQFIADDKTIMSQRIANNTIPTLAV